MKRNILLGAILVTVASTTLLSGCSLTSRHESAIQDREEAGRPVPFYYAFLSGIGTYNGLAYSEGDKIRYWIGGYTYADYDLDSKLAGERQGDEKSFYITAAPLAVKQLAEKHLPEHEYATVTLEKFESPAEIKPSVFYEQVYNSSRAVELDRGFNALHKISDGYVMKNCKLIVDGMNDALPSIFTFDTPEHEDLYMNRMWSPIATQLAAFRYASSKDLSKVDRSYMGTDFKFVEEFRNDKEAPNVVILRRHETTQTFGGFLPNSLTPDYRRFFMSHYYCTPDQVKQARINYLKAYPEALKLSNEIRAKNGLEPEDLRDPNQDKSFLDGLFD